MANAIFAVGHSTVPIERFLSILEAHDVRLLADIRLIPRSRRNPQFDQDSLRRSLAGAGIGYVHLRELGGLRRPRKGSENAGWINESFRGYADYMQTEEFDEALEGLIALSTQQVTAIMCAEGNPRRCHRSLVADALLARGIPVVHISSRGKGKEHVMTSFARVVDGSRVTYP